MEAPGGRWTLGHGKALLAAVTPQMQPGTSNDGHKNVFHPRALQRDVTVLFLPPRQGLHPLPLQWEQAQVGFITASTNTEGQRSLDH